MTRTGPLASVTRRSSESRVRSPGSSATCRSVTEVCRCIGAGDVFNMHVAEDLAALRDLALDFGEGEVVAVAVGGQVAVDLVGGEVVLAVGEVRLHRSRRWS